MFNKILTSVNICLFIFLTYLCFKIKPISYFRPSTTSSYYVEKQTLFDNLPQTSNSIYFLGDSLTDGCEWNELLANPNIKNRGISGDTTEGVLNRLNQVTQSKPQKIFLMIGINDFFNNIQANQILDNYQKVVKTIKTNSPNTKIYIESLLPLNFNLDKSKRGFNNQDILSFNNQLKNLSDNSNIFYIDLYSAFLDTSGQLNKQYTLDGIHLNGQGYLVWKNQLTTYLK